MEDYFKGFPVMTREEKTFNGCQTGTWREEDITAANAMPHMIADEQAAIDRMFFLENKTDPAFIAHISRYGVRPERATIEDSIETEPAERFDGQFSVGISRPQRPRPVEYESKLWTDSEPLGKDAALCLANWDEDGEAGEGVAQHLHGLSGLDRMIAEDCDSYGGRCQRLSINVPTIAKRKRPEVLAKRLGCIWEQAHRFITAWTVIDETGRTWRELTSMAVKMGHVEALAYFESIASDLQVSEYREIELSGINPDAPLLDVSDVWIDRNGEEWIDTVSTTPDMFTLVNINNDEGTPLTIDEHKAALKAFWARQPHPKRFAQLCVAAQNAKIKDLHKIRKALADKTRLKWMSRPQVTRLWAIVNGRRGDLEIVKSQWLRKLAFSLTAVESRSLANLKAAKSEKQVAYYWHLLLSGPMAHVRPIVQEHLFKPALAERARALKAA